MGPSGITPQYTSSFGQPLVNTPVNSTVWNTPRAEPMSEEQYLQNLISQGLITKEELAHIYSLASSSDPYERENGLSRLADFGLSSRKKNTHSLAHNVSRFAEEVAMPAIAAYGLWGLGKGLVGAGGTGAGTTATTGTGNTVFGGSTGAQAGTGSTVFGGTASTGAGTGALVAPAGTGLTSSITPTSLSASTGTAGSTGINMGGLGTTAAPATAINTGATSLWSPGVTAATAGSGGSAFGWLKDVAMGTKSTPGLLGSALEYFNSRDAANSLENAANRASEKADPFAQERPGYMMMLREMMTNPSSFIQDPSYQFRVKQGQDALERSNVAKGYLGSGNMALDLVKYGQDMGSQEYGNQYNRLAQLAGANIGSPAAAAETSLQGQTGAINAKSAQNSALGNVGRSIYENWPSISNGVKSLL